MIYNLTWCVDASPCVRRKSVFAREAVYTAAIVIVVGAEDVKSIITLSANCSVTCHFPLQLGASSSTANSPVGSNHTAVSTRQTMVEQLKVSRHFFHIV